MVLFLLFPVWTSSPGSEGTIYRLYSLFLYSGPSENPESGAWTFWPYLVSGAFAFLAIIVALIETFSYKNRMTQIKMGALNSLLLAGAMISIVWFVTQGQQEWIQSNPGNYSVGIILPTISLIFNLIANRFIRKDEKLVRSMDRIR
jgi:hypothetical protein